MKKKIGKLYNKPIVVGNPNEFTDNEIALSELKGGKENTEWWKPYASKRIDLSDNPKTVEIETLLYSLNTKMSWSKGIYDSSYIVFRGKEYPLSIVLSKSSNNTAYEAILSYEGLCILRDYGIDDDASRVSYDFYIKGEKVYTTTYN